MVTSTEPVDRATPDDLANLASDVGPAPLQVGAVLWLDPAAEVGTEAALDALAERITAIPRLRQRLVPTPPGCGRPTWEDDHRFRIEDHVRALDCPSPGDARSLLDLAGHLIGTRLPPDAALWRIALVRGLDDGGTALVVAFHHVLTDGIGGLAMLAALVDGASPPPDTSWPRPPPSTADLARDAMRSHWTAVKNLRASAHKLRAAAVQLRPAGRRRLVECSLNRPTGARRRLAVVRVELETVRQVAHAHGATVNDVVLTAVTGALHDVLHRRNEEVDRFVVSVPVSGRTSTTTAQLGNQVGAVPVELPAAGDDRDRLAATAEATRAAKHGWRGASNALLGPAFRVLARAGVLRRFIEGQHLVHTFATNIRGPDRRTTFLGAEITDIAAVAIVPGNVTASFAVLSYAGQIDVTIVADPETCPDLEVLRDALDDRFARLARLADS